MIEQAEPKLAILRGMVSRAKPSFLEGMASQAELFFPKARAKTEPSRAELRLGHNTTHRIKYHKNDQENCQIVKFQKNQSSQTESISDDSKFSTTTIWIWCLSDLEIKIKS